ncbi:heptaprenyl diphosphate synthase component II [Niallia taxi]|uniref:Heptaprenyl diphosphate synthase component 2 n=1 Tax=Niallia taxi TaxID=2499688 RepID=A0A3S2UGZ0_9BACI|nr:heptaprenyl diphosphate synthase component II [Niallia taxi]MDK8639841.1 heptaprenyl diphosphate synthase component II [Niallia taxi]MED4040438.1 heptaprenyl diphosphate synthase component II [Niallia taxi]MED4055379.1 heptaprenyl diphosphate synthase component II [Niallia taxi]MED4117570.1 heptaprenyl diphosphate synthase component II [Niallia taxi]RVT65395.1 heptaprenyl diphosphate synthase component II [Niallia taxi]
MKLKMMYSFLNSDLEIIEKTLEETVNANTSILRDSSLHLLKAGGKRIRPIFVLLAGQIGQYDIHVIKKAAVALELIHMASLVHDDVIDDSDLRRGQPTIKAKWDNKVAMYTGDYIFAKSLEIMSELKKPAAHKVLADTIVEVCIGEIQQIKDKYYFEQNVRDYFRRIKRKTALLISASSLVGAIASDVEEKHQKKLHKFGYYVGMSYQIIDDILDFVGTEEELGKPAGGDLLQGNITLPVLYAMEDEGIRKRVSTVHEEMDREELLEIIELIKSTDAIDRSMKISNAYLQKALDAIADLPKGRSKTALINIAKYLGKRKF